VGKARGSQVQPAARNDAVLNRYVLKMVLLEIGGGLHFDQPPAIVSPTLQDIHPHEHVAVFERGFEDRQDFSVRD
jgi:hypothetical protein